MKKLLLTIMVAVISLCAATARDVVYLKNGYVERGRITEHVPGEKVVFVTEDNRTLIFTESEIGRIEKEDNYEPQTNNYSYEQSNFDSPWEAKRGYTGYIDFRLGGYDFYDFVFGLTTTHGYQFNKHVFLGLGIGFELTWNTEYAIPIFLAYNGNVGSGRIQFIYGAKLGLSINDYYYEDYYGGYYGGYYGDYYGDYYSTNVDFMFGVYVGMRAALSEKCALRIAPEFGMMGSTLTFGAGIGFEF